jgi:hypothetical protein
MLIISSESQTKDWRKSQPWWKGGKSNECEIYQRNQIQQITNQQCVKSSKRLNSRTMEFKEHTNPLTQEDGFDWTENFDGYQLLPSSGVELYYNLKMICDKGGAQTRSLREVYHFIEAQIDFLRLHPNRPIYFINILDGDTSFFQKDKFNYLMNLPENAPAKNKIIIEDMHRFRDWFVSNFTSAAANRVEEGTQ